MSNCGYFKIHKGKVSCTHPTYGEEYTNWFGNKLRCNLCRIECNGIYPSQLPYADQTDWEYALVKKSNMSNYLEVDLVIKEWKHGDKVTYDR